MAGFSIYVDESGKTAYPQTEYTTICGYVAGMEEWKRFGNAWSNLRMKWGVPPIHMARIMNPLGKDDEWKEIYEKWGDQWEVKRDAMLEDLTDLIFASTVFCVGAVVDAVAYKKAHNAVDRLLVHKDSNVFGFHHVIMRGIEKISVIDESSLISIVVDDDPQNVMHYYQMLQGLRTHSDPRFEQVKKRISGICFCNDAAYPGLQAADMLAYECRNYARAKAADSQAQPSLVLAKITHGGLHLPLVMDSNAIDTVAKNSYVTFQNQKDE